MNPSPPANEVARFMARSAAILIFVSLLTGFLVAAAMTGKAPADAHGALAAHLNAMLGGFWILGVGWTLPFLRFDERGLRRLAWAIIVPNYANWLVTLVKAFWRVAGVDYVGEGKNDTIFGLLTFLVVLPSLAATGAWI